MAGKKLLSGWTVDYGEGPQAVVLPHAWREDIPVYDEGPVVYRLDTEVPADARVMRFHGVSYGAEVLINRTKAGSHKGIWDAWEVPVERWAGETVQIEVQVTKNGGVHYPVNEAASGFLPFVFHTFGGLYADVEFDSTPMVALDPVSPRVQVAGNRIYLDGEPFYMRGILHWGWYPELGHPNPDDATIRAELENIRAQGFNLVKFCLWVPSHRYLELMSEFGLVGWLELPLWNPSPDEIAQQLIRAELEAIIRQYRHHDCLIAWTVGCELSHSVSAEFRREMVDLVRSETGCPLIKDNSGGSEMYGGDLREYGTFYDFHPYSDTQFFPLVLDSLLPASQTQLPTLLGETNDADVHRDLAKVRKLDPYWASKSPERNAKGVRWQYDLPSVLPKNRFANAPNENRHEHLMESSRRKALFVRKQVTEAIRARDGISGYVITGLRDTPISTAGILDDWAEPRFDANEMVGWNSDDVLYQIPIRRPGWQHGGNRTGWLDSRNFFTGQIFVRVGLAVRAQKTVQLEWSIVHSHGEVVASGNCTPVQISDLSCAMVGEIHWECAEPGEFTLAVHAGSAYNAWSIWVVPRTSLEGYGIYDPAGLLADMPHTADGFGRISTRFRPETRPTIQFLLDDATLTAPFWRESAYEFFDADFWAALPLDERWERFFPICSDRVIDVDELARHWGRDYQVLMNRVDVRTYEEAPVLVRYPHGFVTTLRPFGGLGKQPFQVKNNPVGTVFLEKLLSGRLFGSGTR